jgi:hypothetical protein
MSRLRLTKIVTPTPSPDANKAELFYSSTLSPAALAAIDESGNIVRVGGFTTKDYRLVQVTTILNGTTSYTPTAGASGLFVECVGSGGAGGGAASSAAGATMSVGGGGGGGSYAMKWVTTNVTGIHNSIAVGAGGTPGAAGNNAGGNGNDSTFTDNAAAAIVVGKAGTGGGAGGAAAATLGTRGAGGAGGVAGTGDRLIVGESGDAGVMLTTAAATGGVGGRGGAAGQLFGAGGAQLLASGAGNAGSVYGGGGGGALDASTNNRAGGAGGNGIIRVWEYA